jgi:Zn-dependent protease
VRLRFDRREIRDLFVAWLALGVAFTFFIERSIVVGFQTDPSTIPIDQVVTVFVLSLITVGAGFLLHELAHKVVAIHFGQVAAFRADFGMLFLAILGGIVGFLFAAPGAVYHRGRITKRENGIISAAGPITNLALAAVFFGLVVASTAAGPSFLTAVGTYGVFINLLLAGFNMIPFGPLDGRKVLSWSVPVYLVVAVGTIGPALVLLFGIGI